MMTKKTMLIAGLAAGVLALLVAILLPACGTAEHATTGSFGAQEQMQDIAAGPSAPQSSMPQDGGSFFQGEPQPEVLGFESMASAGLGSAIQADASPSPASQALRRAHRSVGARARSARRSLPAMSLSTEELWVISRPSAGADPVPSDVPSSGALMTEIDGERVPTPLRHTSVEASIHGYIASVNLTQSFHNPFSTKIEAVYVFPLPQNAAVNEFVMTVGERRIRGIIREKEEAQRIYNEARSQGHVASLLNQERANVFTQKVANIEPGKEVDVDITYFHTLAHHDGWYAWSLPMVVGPRYNPPSAADPIEAVSRHSKAPAMNPGGAVPYLEPGERNGTDIDVTVHLNAGFPVQAINSPSHKIVTEPNTDGSRTITLAQNDRIPNKDLVLRWKVAGDAVQNTLLTHVDEEGDGYFSMMLMPPASDANLERAPVELVFVIDSSGSMRGEPMAQVKEAVVRGLDRLLPGDSFQIINFASSTSALGARPLEATSENIARGKVYVDQVAAGGGTNMNEGITAALNFPHDADRTRFVVFMTDGFIGNDQEVLGLLKDELGPSRVFSFGVGSSPNRYLIERMAKLGRGVVAYLNPGDRSPAIIDDFFDRVSMPALTDLRIDWGNLDVHDVLVGGLDGQLPDLYVGRPVIVTGRFDVKQWRQMQLITVGGQAGDGRLYRLPVELAPASPQQASALPKVWARAQIAALADRAPGDPGASKQAIMDIALNHNLVSAFTSFVAVDSAEVTAGQSGVTVGVPVLMPQGVRYDTTVGSRASALP